MKTTFNTILLAVGNNTGIEVPPEKVVELDKGKKPSVNVTIEDYTFKSTVAVMGGMYLIPFAKAHREASGLKGGDSVTVFLELDDAPREVEIPEKLQSALKREGLENAFAKLSYTNRKEACLQVSGAKAEETAERRIGKIIESLK